MEIRGRKEGDRLHELRSRCYTYQPCGRFWPCVVNFPSAGGDPPTAQGYIRQLPPPIPLSVPCRSCSVHWTPFGVQSGTAASRGFSDGAKSLLVAPPEAVPSSVRDEGPRGSVFFSLNPAVFVSRNHVDSEGDTGREAIHAGRATSSRARDRATDWERAVPALFRLEQIPDCTSIRSCHTIAPFPSASVPLRSRRAFRINSANDFTLHSPTSTRPSADRSQKSSWSPCSPTK